MSQFSGPQDFTGPKGDRKNKGVMARRRQQKREEADARDLLTKPERRSNKQGRRLLAQIFTKPEDGNPFGE